MLSLGWAGSFARYVSLKSSQRVRVELRKAASHERELLVHAVGPAARLVGDRALREVGPALDARAGPPGPEGRCQRIDDAALGLVHHVLGQVLVLQRRRKVDQARQRVVGGFRHLSGPFLLLCYPACVVLCSVRDLTVGQSSLRAIDRRERRSNLGAPSAFRAWLIRRSWRTSWRSRPLPPPPAEGASIGRGRTGLKAPSPLRCSYLAARPWPPPPARPSRPAPSRAGRGRRASPRSRRGW